MSIDPRPILQPDERGKVSHYVGNSTARKIAELSKHTSPAELGKLSTTELIVRSADAERRPAAVADTAVAEVGGLHHALKQAEAANAVGQREIDVTAPLRAVALRFKGHD